MDPQKPNGANWKPGELSSANGPNLRVKGPNKHQGVASRGPYKDDHPTSLAAVEGYSTTVAGAGFEPTTSGL